MAGGYAAIDPRWMPSLGDAVDEQRRANPFLGGLGAGIHQILGLGGSAVQGAGSLFGLPGVEAAGKGFADRQEIIANRIRPDLEVAPWQSNGASILPWAEYQLGKLIPTVGGFVGAAALTPEAAVPAGARAALGALPRFLGGLGEAAATSTPADIAAAGLKSGKFLLGGGAFGASQGFGQAIQSADQAPGGLTRSAAAQAAAEAPLYGAASLLTPGFLTGRVFDAAEQGALRVPVNTLKGSAIGAVQSGLMTAMDQTFRPDLSPQDKMSNIVDSTVAGAAIAGLAGGLTSIRGFKKMDPNTSTDTLDQATKNILEPDQQRQLDLQPPAAAFPKGYQPDLFGIGDTYDQLAAQLKDVPTDTLEKAAKGKASPQSIMAVRKELANRKALESQQGVEPAPVEAVEPGLPLPAAGGTEAPASASPPYIAADRVDELGKGMRLPADFKRAANEMPNEQALQDFVHDQIFNQQDNRATVRKFAQRMGMLDDKFQPGPLAEEVAARKTRAAWDAEWNSMAANRQGQEPDPALQALAPTDRADAQRLVARALEGPARPEAGLGFTEVSDQMERVGRDLGLLDAKNEWTPEGKRILQRSIPFEETAQVALDKGFKGAEINQFDRGAHFEGDTAGQKFDDFREMKAFQAGHEWALQNDIPDMAETKKRMQAMQLGEHIVGGNNRQIQREQLDQRSLNAMVDKRFDPLTHPEENAQLKQMVAEGDDLAAIEDAARYYESGHGALVTPPAPARPTDVNVRPTKFGNTYVPEPTVGRVPADVKAELSSQRAANYLASAGRSKEFTPEEQNAIEVYGRKQEVRDNLLAGLKSAADNGDLAGGDYVKLRSALNSGDHERVAAALSDLGARPYMHLNGQNVFTPGDRVRAIDLVSKINESDGSARTAMNLIAGMGGDLGNMARRFAKYIPNDLRMEVVKPEDMAQTLGSGFTVHGLYEPRDKTIYVATSVPHPSVILHELMHSVINEHIQQHSPVGKEIISIFNKFKRMGPKTDYAFRNPEEFMAEFLSRKQVRDYIRDFSRQNNIPSLFGRIWQAIKNAFGGNKGGPSQNYVERLLNLAEQAGANPLGLDGRELNRPYAVNDKVKEKIEGITDKVGQIIQRDGLLSTARKTVLGWATVHDIVEHWGKWFEDKTGFNPVKAYERALNDKQSIVARMAQMMTTARDQVQQVLGEAKNSGQAIVQLMRMSEFGIDPTKPWADQPAIVRESGNPHLEGLHASAYKLWHEQVVKPGYAHVYQNLRNVNDTLMLSQLATTLHAQVSNDTWANKDLTEFARGPMERFMEAQETEDYTPERAREWWNDALNAQLADLDKFTRRQDSYASLLADDGKEGREKANILDRLGPIEDRIKNIRATIKQMEDAPYFHLGRFGNYFVGWHVNSQEALGAIADHLADKGFGTVISKPSLKEKVYVRLENERQAVDLRKEIEDFAIAHPDMIDPASIIAGDRGNDTVRAGLADQWFNRVVSDIKNNEDLDKEAKDAAIDALRSLHLDLMPENSLSRVMTHREGVPGYSSDMLRAFEHRANVGINALAGMVVSPKITQAFTSMRDMRDNIQRGISPDGKPVTQAQRVGVTHVIDELSTRERERAEWPQTKFLDQLRATNHAWFLGGSISYGLVNLSQLFATALPELGSQHGYVASAKAMAKVSPMVTKIVSAIASEGYKVSLSRAMDAVLTRGVLDKALGEGHEDVKRFIMQVANTGQLDIGGASRELMRAAAGRNESGGWNATLRYASAIGYYTETASRLVVALAAHELNPHLDLEKSAENASHVLKESMWDYSQANQGRQFGKKGFLGPVTPLATAFMQYTAQLTGKLYRTTYEAIKGDNAKERDQARRFLAGHLASMTVLAGTLGLPMVSALAAAYDQTKDLFDGDGHPNDVRADWRNFLSDTFGKNVGEVLARGATREAGFDISQRVGEQDLLPFSKFIADRRNFKDSIKDLQSRSWGAPSSMLANALQGGEQITNGDLLGGLSRMLPNALAAPVKAYRLAGGKYVDANGKELPMTPGARDVALQLLGFNPSPAAEYSEARQSQAVLKGQLTRNATQLRTKLVQAVLDKDHGTAHDMLNQIREFNNANPAYEISGQDIAGAIRRQAKQAAISKHIGAPLGVRPIDQYAQQLTRYANIPQ